MNESELIFNSIYYCPHCTGGGQLFVDNNKAYFDQKDYNYYCKKCKRTFKIEEISTKVNHKCNAFNCNNPATTKFKKTLLTITIKHYYYCDDHKLFYSDTKGLWFEKQLKVNKS